MSPDKDRDYEELPGEILDEQTTPLLHYVTALLRRRWLIVGGTVILVILVGAYTKLLMTPVYTAAVKFLPSKGSDMSARMSTIVGTSMRLDGAEDTASVDYYTALLQSPLFLERIIKKPFRIERLEGEKPLLDYFEVIADTEAERLQKGVEALAKMVKPSAGRPVAGRITAPIITITVMSSEPRLSADVANAFLAELIVYNQSIRNAKAIQNRMFIEKQLKDNQELLNKAENDVATFTARNRKIATPDLEAQKDRLTRVLTVQEEVFITLKKQLELARIEEQENQPAVEIIERALPPLARSAPSARRNVMIAGFLGLMLFSGLALALDMVKKLDREDEATREFLTALEEVKGDFVKIGKSF